MSNIVQLNNSTIVTGATALNQYLVCKTRYKQIGIPVYQFQYSNPPIDFVNPDTELTIDETTLYDYSSATITPYNAAIAVTINGENYGIPIYTVEQNDDITPAITFHETTTVSDLTARNEYVVAILDNEPYGIPLVNYSSLYPFTSTMAMSAIGINTVITSMKASISIECNPFSDYTLPDSFSRRRDFVHFLPLEKGEDSIYNNFSRGAKRSLNKADEKGVVVRRIQAQEELKSYFKVYRSTLQRWGDATRVTFPEKIFSTLFHGGGDAVKFWVAEKETTVIAVLTLVYWNRMVHGFHAAALKEYFDCCPNNILHMEAIRDAIKNNYRFYDFGASGGMEGVIRFKESMGAEKREFIAGHWKSRRVKRG